MNFSLQDLRALDALMREVAAAEITPRFGTLASGDIHAKTSADDLVTTADLRAEAALSAGLLKLFPQAIVTGEEALSEDTPEGGFDYDAPELLFVIDPVDGTWPFAQGMPIFGSMVAVLEHGETVAGVIHYPISGESLVCLQQHGVHLIDATGKARALPPMPSGAELQAGIAGLSQTDPQRQKIWVDALADVPRVMGFYCSAWEYRLLLLGSVDFLFNDGLNPWDHLAGQLMVAELGGEGLVLEGGDWRDDPAQAMLISARTPSLANELRARLRRAAAQLAA